MATQTSANQQDVPERDAEPQETWHFSPAPEGTQEQAGRSVMHPEAWDAEWRYYHGAWGG